MLRTLEKHVTKKQTLLFLIVIVSLAFTLQTYNEYKRTKCLDTYTYVNNIVVCGPPDVIEKSNYNELKLSILSYIEKQKDSARVEDVAVYFRDLIHGPIFGINELQNYAPASLLKLPLAIAYLNTADIYPGLLDKRIGFTSTTTMQTLTQNFPPAVTIETGHFYSINDLIFNMLAYSDNKSYSLLATYFQNHFPNGSMLLHQSYQDLGILAPQNTLDENISVHSYASIFRNLYNASYVDPKSSEKILSWLAQSSFNLGLVAGVPANVRVAHKFGEFTLPNNINQLHDCGIIYYPGNPYLLCIMTRGTDWEELKETIQHISAMTYAEVDSRKL